MSTLTKSTAGTRRITDSRDSSWSAFFELIKPRISTMVLITVVVAAVLGSPTWPGLLVVFNAAVSIALIAASGNAFNMYVERYTDILMPRTATRPLPDKRLTAGQVASFGAICFGAGVAYMATAVNMATTICGIGTWVLYVLIYTPLKTKTPYNTEVGAVAGAMPILMGGLATSGTINATIWIFFAVLFCWQFPHFMAIAWMYRDQYRDGGLKMLTVTEPTGRAAGKKAIVYAFATWTVSLLPVFTFTTQGGVPIVGIVFAVLATVASVYYIRASIAFSADRNDATARRLLRVSISYLPAYMLMLVVCSLIS